MLQIDEALLYTTPAPPVQREGTMEEVERAHILRVLHDMSWVIEGKQGAAARLGLHPNTLRSRMQKLGIKKSRPTA